MVTNVSPMSMKKALIGVVDELPPERITELLEFALFMKARQMKQFFQIDAYIEKFISPQQINIFQPVYPLHGSVIFYDDPFASVAESDWEILQ